MDLVADAALPPCVARTWRRPLLREDDARLEGHRRLIASAIIALLAVSLVRNGLAGLTG